MAQSSPTSPGREPVRANSVQGYIDEAPLWADGTTAPPSRLTEMQQRIWWLSVAGKFFEGLVVFLTGVALPLIAKEYDLSEAQHGIVGAASLFGILIGASALGGLSDRFGRKPMFVFEMGLFIFFLVLIVFTQNFIWLVVAQRGTGAMIISPQGKIVAQAEGADGLAEHRVALADHRGLEHAGADEVLGSDQLEVSPLATQLALDRGVQLGIALRELRHRRLPRGRAPPRRR